MPTDRAHDEESEGRWVYMDAPEAVRMPPCRSCRNRLGVHPLFQGIWWCGDCMRPFAAVWVRPGVVPPEIVADP